MAVYYRYRSGVDTFSLPLAAPSVSVAELKRLIMGTSRHGHGRTRGRGPREGIAISDAQTGEEYTDDNALVLRNSTVVVRRVAGPPADTIVAPSTQRPKANQDGGGSSSDSAASRSRSSAADDDAEAKAISAVIDAAELKWEAPSQYGHRGAAYHGRAPPPGYVCHRCRVPGHFIQHCPTNGDPRFDFGKATTVLPQAPTDDHDDDGVPADLHCNICKKVMADAVMTSKCCFSSFCDRCIRAHIVANCKCACGAHARADDLIPNPTLRTTISNILAARASSASCGRTEKQRSSVGSNAVAETQSPAASQHSHVSSKKGASSEHSDGSESTSTPAAAHGPRMEQETTDTAGARAANHADHHYGRYDVPPFPPAGYNPFFPWSADPSMYYGYGGMPYAYGGGYPMGSHHVDAMGNVEASYGYHGERHDGRKRTGCDDQRLQDRSFKRRCGGGRSQVALVLT